jgi:AcrR family transcriptional regulator|tara:strand:+ start:3118 stop:3702 length:585 start_codon:yes stop_codon:yes gene_type:complete
MARTAGSHSGITGPKVRQAALELFAKHGYAAVSMRQIASEVGVQAGALYNYTPDKQSLLFDLMQSHMAELIAALPDVDAGQPLQRLEHFVRFHIAFHHDRPEAVFIAYMELRNLNAQNFLVIGELRGTYEDRLQGILLAGQASGAWDVKDAKIATFAVIAMLTGVNTWFRSEGRLSLNEVQDQYWEMVRKAVGA